MQVDDRLRQLDEFGSRKSIFPAEVKGRFRRWRNRIYTLLLVFFLALPWIKINGLQAVLIDIPNRRFEIFGLLFLAHDAPFIFFLLAIAALGLAWATAVWGRVWCGWACPQTVFIDAIYRRIELWIEGNYLARRQLHEGPMSWRKLRLSGIKWFAYLVVSSLFAHSFIAYFTGSDELIRMIQRNPSENWSYFVVVSFVTALLMFDFGWFREQFCIIMCPYGRFQSVLMDSRSVIIGYDERRGEPRKSVTIAKERWGDCVSCNRCVQVCPTGIDIRNGLQMECIACTACIDACDEIMTKVNRPTGLISYQGAANWTRSLRRPRVLGYTLILILLTSIFLFKIADREAFSVTILRAQDTPYQLLPENQVINHFKAHLRNQSHHREEFKIHLPNEMIEKGLRITQSEPLHEVQTGEVKEVHFFVIFPQSLLDGRGEAKLQVEVSESASGRTQSFNVKTVGPYSTGS